MLRTSGKRQTITSEKSITGVAATDTALWRLSLVLKEIAESVVREDEEKTSVELIAGALPYVATIKQRKGVIESAVIKTSAQSPKKGRC